MAQAVPLIHRSMEAGMLKRVDPAERPDPQSLRPERLAPFPGFLETGERSAHIR